MNDQTEATTTAPAAEPKSPRGPSPENQARLDYITQRAANEPGVHSPTIAKELGMTTLACGQLADRLVRKGEILLHKLADGKRTYYPKGYDLSSIPAEAPPEPKPKPAKVKEAKPKKGGKKKEGAADPAA